jgi:hypothetical protein
MKDARKVSRIRFPQVSHRPRLVWVESWRAFVVTSYFVIVFGAILFIGTTMVTRTIQNQTNSKGVAVYGRTARVSYPLLDGVFCRSMVFDNRTEQTIEDKISRCDGGSNGSSKFKWGGDGR